MAHFPITLMPTKKSRLNVTLKKDTAIYLKEMALHDEMSESAKAAQLIEVAMEIESDGYWNARAEAIEKKNKGWLTDEQFWKGIV